MKEDSELIFVAILYSIGLFTLGVFMGITISAKTLDETIVASYTQGTMACEQFHKAQERRDQLQGVPKTSGRIQ